VIGDASGQDRRPPAETAAGRHAGVVSSGPEPTSAEPDRDESGSPTPRRPDAPTRPAGPAAGAAMALIRGYKTFLSPLLPPSCRFVPSCSEYGHEAIAKYGIIRGGRLAVWRILRCNPFGRGGYDPVP